MKQWMTMLLTVMLCVLLSVSVCAEETTVYVTIVDEHGAAVLADEPIALTDADGDGTCTINDVMLVAHEEHHSDGAAAYASAETEYGLSMTKLWGTENGGSYGYYRNHASAYSLVDPVSAGDNVTAFVYTDTVSWSDTYSWFEAASDEDGTVTLTLSAYTSYDESWNPVAAPVVGAVITIDGETTEYVTDADGRVTLSVPTDASVISAVSDTLNLVPPIYRVSRSEETAPTATTATTSSDAIVAPQSGVVYEPITTTTVPAPSADGGNVWWLVIGIAAGVAAAVLIVLVAVKIKHNEK